MSGNDILDLVRRAQGGDREAFGGIYDQYADRIFAYVLSKLRSRPEAEDITEQVFVNALDGLERFDPASGSLGGWLYRIAHNLIVDTFRRRGRVVEVELDEAALSASTPSLDEVYSRTEAAQEVRKAVDQLTREQRQVILLRFFGNQSNEAVAQVMGKTEGSIKALQHRALRSLGRILGEIER